MAETISFPRNGSKQEKYEAILPQVKAILESETDVTANSANLCAVLKEVFQFWWVGFYWVREKNSKKELVLGAFQGPLACTRIGYHKGVCGSAWAQKQTLIVPDVEQFPGHIACSSASRSEIVVPVFASTGEVLGVLDVDSEHLAHFDEVDGKYLQDLLKFL